MVFGLFGGAKKKRKRKRRISNKAYSKNIGKSTGSISKDKVGKGKMYIAKSTGHKHRGKTVYKLHKKTQKGKSRAATGYATKRSNGSYTRYGKAGRARKSDAAKKASGQFWETGKSKGVLGLGTIIGL